MNCKKNIALKIVYKIVAFFTENYPSFIIGLFLGQLQKGILFSTKVVHNETCFSWMKCFVFKTSKKIIQPWWVGVEHLLHKKCHSGPVDRIPLGETIPAMSMFCVYKVPTLTDVCSRLGETLSSSWE